MVQTDMDGGTAKWAIARWNSAGRLRKRKVVGMITLILQACESSKVDERASSKKPRFAKDRFDDITSCLEFSMYLVCYLLLYLREKRGKESNS